jgi:hypothetical protein
VLRRGSKLRSYNARLDMELAGLGSSDVQGAAAEAAGAPQEPLYDCLGLAQAMVDMSATAEDGLLARLQLEKGSRRFASCCEWRCSLLSAPHLPSVGNILPS